MYVCLTVREKQNRAQHAKGARFRGDSDRGHSSSVPGPGAPPRRAGQGRERVRREKPRWVKGRYSILCCPVCSILLNGNSLRLHSSSSSLVLGVGSGGAGGCLTRGVVSLSVLAAPSFIWRDTTSAHRLQRRERHQRSCIAPASKNMLQRRTGAHSRQKAHTTYLHFPPPAKLTPISPLLSQPHRFPVQSIFLTPTASKICNAYTRVFRHERGTSWPPPDIPSRTPGRRGRRRVVPSQG